MAKYRKKPVVIEAMQWDGGNMKDIVEFMAGQYPSKYKDKSGKLRIATLEGPLTASVGDWIIKGVHGEFYPCKPDIFRATYEPVDSAGGGE